MSDELMYNVTNCSVSGLNDSSLLLYEKFIFVGVTGSVIACFGLVFNAFLLYVFTRKELRSANSTFLFTLALLDIFVCLGFLSIFAVEATYEYYNSVTLYHFWLTYIRVAYMGAKATQTMSALVMLSATLERYLAVNYSSTWARLCKQRNCKIFVFGLFIFSAGSRLVIYWEVVIVENKDCDSFGSSTIAQSEFAHDPAYRILYNLGFSHICMVMGLFLLIAGFNAQIILRVRNMLRHQYARALLPNFAGAANKEALKSTTRGLIVVSCSYIVCYSLQFLIATMELCDPGFLSAHRLFYSFSRDTINFLTVLNSSIRFLLYLPSNWKIRRQAYTILGGRDKGYQTTTSTDHDDTKTTKT